MSSKIFEIEELGTVRVLKSRRSKNIRISLKPDGSINVSVPYWTPYKVALDFVNSRKDWINQHRSQPDHLTNGDRIGKAHRLQIIVADVKKPYSKITDNQIIVKYPETLSADSPQVQKLANKKAIEALHLEASSLLPQRLKFLANKHSFEYKSVDIKTLKSRWGSCNSNKEILLSCFLMQLDWKQIDYVIIHELTHTLVMAHNEKFWKIVNSLEPDYKAIRKGLANHKPHIIAQK